MALLLLTKQMEVIGDDNNSTSVVDADAAGMKSSITATCQLMTEHTPRMEVVTSTVNSVTDIGSRVVGNGVSYVGNGVKRKKKGKASSTTDTNTKRHKSDSGLSNSTARAVTQQVKKLRKTSAATSSHTKVIDFQGSDVLHAGSAASSGSGVGGAKMSTSHGIKKKKKKKRKKKKVESKFTGKTPVTPRLSAAEQHAIQCRMFEDLGILRRAMIRMDLDRK